MDALTASSCVQNNLNVDPKGLEEIKLDHIEKSKQPPLKETPPHNGFGDPQDSLLNCKKLVCQPFPSVFFNASSIWLFFGRYCHG